MIPVNTPLLSGNEKKYLLECINTGWISSEGPFVHRFENEFARYIGKKYAIAVANGSAALDIAVKAAGIKKGDEVLMPAFTIISPAASVVRQGAVPVLVDSDPLTWNMNASLIEKKITKKTKAILMVHIYGLPADVDAITEIARKYKLNIIEDAAEMHGQTYKGKKCGSFGNISIFSFYSNKIITTGEGGMILTDDETIAAKCASMRNLCFIPGNRFVHEELGWNYRMTNLQAALGLAQLEQIDEHITRKRMIGKLYTSLLKKISCIDLPLESASFADNIYWVYGILLNEKCKLSVRAVTSKLSECGIDTRPFFYPMHLQPVFRKMGLFKKDQHPVAEKLYNSGFYLPSGLGLKDEEIKIIAGKLKEILS